MRKTSGEIWVQIQFLMVKWFLLSPKTTYFLGSSVTAATPEENRPPAQKNRAYDRLGLRHAAIPSVTDKKKRQSLPKKEN